VEQDHGVYSLVLRAPLARQIGALLNSDDTDQWTGKRVVLFGEPVRVAGRDVVALRARLPKAQ
jgi:hypothetical protein